VYRLPKQPDFRMLRGQVFEDHVGAIGRAIIDDHQFPVQALRQGSLQHHRQTPVYDSPFVIDRNQNGQKHTVHHYNWILAPTPQFQSSSVVLETNLDGYKLFGRGKVRDVYEDASPDRLLIVTTDRISAFDYILPTGIPNKGRVLTQMTLFWLEFLKDV